MQLSLASSVKTRESREQTLVLGLGTGSGPVFLSQQARAGECRALHWAGASKISQISSVSVVIVSSTALGVPFLNPLSDDLIDGHGGSIAKYTKRFMTKELLAYYWIHHTVKKLLSH